MLGCATTSDSPYAKPNSLMAQEIEKRVAEIPYQHRNELFENMLWLAQAGEQAIPTLLSNLNHDSAKVRSNVAWILGRIGDRRTIPDLERIATDPQDTVRLEVARSLVLLGDVKYAPTLIEGLDSEKLQVRYNCHEALRTATGRDFGYDHLAENPVDRQMAVLRWRQWWGEQNRDPWFAQSYADTHGLSPSQTATPTPPPAGEPFPAPQVETMPRPTPERTRTIEDEIIEVTPPKPQPRPNG
jgi:hypothetical protein